MASEVFPIIDLSKHDNWHEVLGNEIVSACKTWGFMILTGHGIPLEEINHMFELHKDFCSQPLEVKSESKIDQRQIGYDLKNSKIGRNECMVFGGTRGEIAEGKGVPSWWDAVKRQEVEDFKAKAHALSVKLLQVFARHFGLPTDYFSSAHNDQVGQGSVLRMLHYPKIEQEATNDFPRLRAHTDWGSVTFVWSLSGGLEVETPLRKWMSVPSVPDSVLVNIGDAMSLWSGKTLKSTLHRIKSLPVTQDRWSMAYFLNANTDSRLEVLQNDGSDSLKRISSHSPVITMGQYQQARHYLSQKEDAANNWLGSTAVSLDAWQKYLGAVESLGVANGSEVGISA